MSLKSDTARLEQILEYIEDITKIVYRHENTVTHDIPELKNTIVSLLKD